MSQEAWKGQDLIAFLKHLTPKALKLDSKENLLKEHVDLRERPLLIMEDSRGKCILGSIKFQQLEDLLWSKH